MKKYLSFIVSLPVLFASCGESFTPDFDTEPIAVLNSMIMPGKVVTASVSHSFIGTMASLPQDADRRLVRDAKVELYVNGAYQDEMKFDTIYNKFVSYVKVNPEDEIAIYAHTDKYGDAKGQTVVPDSITGASWTYTVTTETDYDTVIIGGGEVLHPKAHVFNYAITFKDPADEENYYFLMSESTDFECNDPITGENDSPLDAVYSQDARYLIFSDKSISGKEYTLNCSFKITNSYWDPAYGINQVCLYSISKDYYLYLLSLYKKYEGLNGELENLGLAEPKFIYSNVNPGVGIVAAQTPVVDIIHDVREYLEND